MMRMMQLKLLTGESEFNLFSWLEVHWKRLVLCIPVLTVITVITILAFQPQVGFVFEGRITKINFEQVSVYIRNNNTISEINASVGICYDEQLNCFVNDRVEVTQYVGEFGEEWVVTAIVD